MDRDDAWHRGSNQLRQTLRSADSCPSPTRSPPLGTRTVVGRAVRALPPAPSPRAWRVNWVSRWSDQRDWERPCRRGARHV